MDTTGRSILTFFVSYALFCALHRSINFETWPKSDALTMLLVSGAAMTCVYIVGARKDMQLIAWRDRVCRSRAFDALVWWSSEGRSLAKDSSYVLATVRQLKGGPSGKSREQIMAAYQDSSDLCATVAKAEYVAGYVLKALPQLVADHVEPEARNLEGLTRIFRRHFRRDIVLLEEAKNYQLNTAVHGVADESPTHLVERLLREFNAVSLARELGLKRIQELAAALPEDKREAFIAAAIAGINASLDAWMLTQASRTD